MLGQDNSTGISRYDITANLDTAKGELYVIAKLVIDKSDSTEIMSLLLNSAIRLDSIIGEENGNLSIIDNEFVGKDTIQLKLPTLLIQNGKFSMNFYYSYPIGKPTNAPLLLDRGHRWYPLITDNIAKLYLTVTTPGDYDAFSAGDMTSVARTADSAWTVWETAIPVFKVPLLMAKRGYYKELIKELSDDKELSLHFSSADSVTARAIIDEVSRSFEFYSEYIGEYGHRSLRLLEVPQFPGVNIGTGIITFGKDEIEAFKIGNKDRIDLAIANQWMGAGIFGKFPSRGFWFMSISMPHYLRLMYLQKVKGEEVFQKNLNDLYGVYKPIAGTDNDIPILDVDFLNTKEKGAIIYGKGPYAVNILRNRLGDEVWQRLWRGLYWNYKGKIISFDQLIEYISSEYDRDRTAVSELEKLVNGKGLLGK